MAWNGSDRKKNETRSAEKQPQTSKRHLPFIPVFTIVFAAITLSLFFFYRELLSTAPAPAADMVHQPKSPAKQIKPAVKIASKTTNEATVVKTELKPVRLYKGLPIKSQTFTTNVKGRVTETIITADGRSHRKYHEPKQIFKYASDDLLVMFLKARPGDSIPPIPISDSIDRDFKKSLEEPIVFAPDDSYDVKLLKASVCEARELMRKIMNDEGKTFREVIAEHERLQNNRAESHDMALKIMRDMIDSGETDNAIEFAKAFNEKYKDTGVTPLKVPQHKQDGKKK